MRLLEAGATLDFEVMISSRSSSLAETVRRVEVGVVDSTGEKRSFVAEVGGVGKERGVCCLS